MDNKTLIAMIIAGILAVSAVGVAYAYTASTENADNEVTTDFLKILQQHEENLEFEESYSADFSDAIYWDSFTASSDRVIWTLNYADMGEEFSAQNPVLLAAANVADGINTPDNESTEVNEEVICGLILIGQSVLQIVPNGNLSDYDLYLYNTAIDDGKFFVVISTGNSAENAVEAAGTAQAASNVKELSNAEVTRASALAATPAFSGLSADYVCISVYAMYEGYIAPAQEDNDDTPNVNETLPSIHAASSTDLSADYGTFTLSFAAQLHEYMITGVGDQVGGAVTASKTTGLHTGDEVTLTFTPADQKALTALTINGVDKLSDVENNQYNLVVESADVVIVATFS